MAVVGADVEEARVHEDGDALLREDDVGTHTDTWGKHRQVYAEAEPGTVQRRPEGKLRLGVSAAVPSHRGSYGLTGRGGRGGQPHDGHSFGKYFLAFSWGDTIGGRSSPNTGLVQSAHLSSG